MRPIRKLTKKLKKLAYQNPNKFSCFHKGKKRIRLGIHHDENGNVAVNLLIRAYYNIQCIEDISEDERTKYLNHLYGHTKDISQEAMREASAYEMGRAQEAVYKLQCQYINMSGVL